MRQIVLDTETTGLNPKEGHRIIEVGCVELINRRLTENRFHIYLNPGREIDQGAIEVHGITNEFLADKPRFEDIQNDLLAFITDAELIIHNAPFDVGFLNYELTKAGRKDISIEQVCTILDTLVMAREKHPGQRNSLDALCKRYGIDNTHRTLHGALLDAEILADVFLLMTGGQLSLFAEEQSVIHSEQIEKFHKLTKKRSKLRVIACDQDELKGHQKTLEHIEKVSSGQCKWKQNR